MSIQIKLKNSVVQDSTPSTSDLPEVGELAVNANINSIGGFMRASDNSIVKIFGPGSLSTPTATTTVSGISELATNSETTTGTATNRVVTPAGLNAVTVAERSTSNSTYLALAGGTLTGVLTMPNGSNSAAAINFGDSDSGIFGGTNTVSLTAGGTTRLTADTGVSVVGTLAVTGAITTTSDLTIPDKIIHSGDTNTAIRFPAADTVSVETGGSEAFRVNNAQRVLIGTSSSKAIGGTVHGLLQIEGTNSKSHISIVRNEASNGGAFLTLGKSRSATVGGNTVVQDDDGIGTIRFSGADGTDIQSEVATIAAFVDGTPGANDMPGRLVFSTTADGAASPTTRLTIDSTGLSTFTGQIISNGTFTIENTGPAIVLKDTDHNSDFQIKNENGQFRIRDTTNSQNRFTIASDGVADITGNLNCGADLTIDTNTLHVDSSNNRVGIGTTTPNEELTIQAGDILVRSDVTTGSANSHAIGFSATATGGLAASISSARENANEASALTFKTWDGSATGERMRLDSSGRLLIGGTSVGSASSFYDDVVISNTTSGTGAGLTFIANATNGFSAIDFADTAAGGRGRITYSHGDDDLRIDTAGSERMRIDSSGRILAGVSSARTIFKMGASGNGQTPTFQFETANDDANNSLSLTYGRNNAFGAEIFIAKHRGASVGGTTIVQGGDRLGALTFAGSDGTNFQPAASIEAEIDATPGTDDMPGRLLFSTTADGAKIPTERMRIDSSGNVGIGVAPATILHVRANVGDLLRLDRDNQGSVGNQIAFRHKDANSAYVETGSINCVSTANADAGDLRFNTKTASGSNTERMRIDSSGRVLIGTTTEGFGTFGEALTLASSGHTGMTIRSVTSHRGSIYFSDGTSGDTEYQGYIQYNHDDGRLVFGTTATERIRIDGSGNVGIGITPTCGLHIDNPNNAAIAQILDTDNSAVKLVFRNNTETGNAVQIGANGSRLVFVTGSNERGGFDADGRLLIGATSSFGNGTDRLMIKKGNDGGRISFGTDAGFAECIVGQLNGYWGNNKKIAAISFFGGNDTTNKDDGNIRFATSSANNLAERMRINEDGRVLINTLTVLHQSMLTIKGNGVTTITTEANLTSAFTHHIFNNPNGQVGDIRTSGNSTIYNTSSDYRLKENVVAITDGITRLKTLKPYRFNFKADKDTTVDGFFAHEVTAVPEAISGEKDAVNEDGSINPQGIDQSKLVPLLVAAVQELIGRVEKLEAA